MLSRLRHARSLHASFWLVLLVAATLVRGLMPAGYMPGFGQGSVVVLCTQQGAVTAPAGDAADHAQSHCPYGFAIGMAAAPPAAGSMEIPAAAHEAPAAVSTFASVADVRANYSARAPPYLA